MRTVLDASAALAWLGSEPGHEIVRPLLPEAIVSSINWSEILQKISQKGRDADVVAPELEDLGVRVVEATRGDAILAARYWEHRTKLSLADRFCLALAYRFDLPAVTAERAWIDYKTGTEIIFIR